MNLNNFSELKVADGEDNVVWVDISVFYVTSEHKLENLEMFASSAGNKSSEDWI